MKRSTELRIERNLLKEYFIGIPESILNECMKSLDDEINKIELEGNDSDINEIGVGTLLSHMQDLISMERRLP